MLLPSSRWLTQDLHYYARFFRERERFSPLEQAEIVTFVGGRRPGPLACASGHGLLFLLLVLLPARLAIAATASMTSTTSTAAPCRASETQRDERGVQGREACIV